MKYIIVIIILGLVAYANSLNGEFIRDDTTLIRDNIYLRSWDNVSKCFTGNIALGGGSKWNSYRPLQIFTYMVDYSLWKLDVRGYHLTNTILHILAALCIFSLLNILYDDKLLSLFTSVLFVVHPIHTGAVSYISGRADSLACIFMLLTFIFYIKILDKKNIKFYLLMLLTYILALLSRENSLVLPILLLLYHYVFKKKSKIENFIPIVSLALVYIFIRLAILKPLLSNITYTTTLVERLPGFFVAITNYVRLLLLPFDLYAGYGSTLFKFADPKALLGILISASLLFYAFKIKDRNNLIFFSILWFFIALLPQSNLYPINAFMAEHWLYLPSIGFFVILANVLKRGIVIHKGRGRLNVPYFLFLCLLVFYSFLTIRQNDYWREDIAFYKRTLMYTPNDFGEYNNLGLAYYNKGRIKEAISSFNKATELNPRYADAYYNLGKAHYHIGNDEKAIIYYRKAIMINPHHAGMHNNIGLSYFSLGRVQEAIASYKRAIAIDPRYADAYFNLGNLYYNIGRLKEAAAAFKRVLDINPRDREARHNLAAILKVLPQTLSPPPNRNSLIQ